MNVRQLNSIFSHITFYFRNAYDILQFYFYCESKYYICVCRKELVFTTAFFANFDEWIFHIFASGRCPEGGNPLASIACLSPKADKSVPTKRIASSSVFGTVRTHRSPCFTRDFNYSKEIIEWH
jgi:hypothetical protein